MVSCTLFLDLCTMSMQCPEEAREGMGSLGLELTLRCESSLGLGIEPRFSARTGMDGRSDNSYKIIQNPKQNEMDICRSDS